MCSIKCVMVDFLLGFFCFCCSIASPIIDCGSGWSYGHHLSGRGCLRQLTNQYNQKTCLLNGYHLTLTAVPWGDLHKSDIYCVKDERYPHEIPTTDDPHSIGGINDNDLKIDLKKQIQDQAKEDIAKAMGCCLEGLHPSG